MTSERPPFGSSAACGSEATIGHRPPQLYAHAMGSGHVSPQPAPGASPLDFGRRGPSISIATHFSDNADAESRLPLSLLVSLPLKLRMPDTWCGML